MCGELQKAIKNSTPVSQMLDKMIAEIMLQYSNCNICEWFEDYDYEENNVSEYTSVGHVSDIIEIIDKYKAESE